MDVKLKKIYIFISDARAKKWTLLENKYQKQSETNKAHLSIFLKTTFIFEYNSF